MHYRITTIKEKKYHYLLYYEFDLDLVISLLFKNMIYGYLEYLKYIIIILGIHNDMFKNQNLQTIFII